MKITVLSLVLIATVSGLCSTDLLAAPPSFGRPNRPTVSPYINLLNNNIDPAITYYGIIRPEQELRATSNANAQSLSNLTKRVARNEQKIEMPSGRLSASGHATSFGNTRGYFPGSRR